jgi:hypothetical protein
MKSKIYYEEDVDQLSKKIENLNITEEDAFFAAQKLEKYMTLYDEVEALMSKRVRKFGHYC